MKHVFCKTLASCLRMKRSPPSSVEQPQICRRSSIEIEERHSNSPHYNDMSTLDAPPTKSETAEKILQEMLDLQKARIHYKEQHRNEAVKENEIKNDWMLAAAVVDRICAIVFGIVFIGGTVIFITLIATHGRIVR